MSRYYVTLSSAQPGSWLVPTHNLKRTMGHRKLHRWSGVMFSARWDAEKFAARAQRNGLKARIEDHQCRAHYVRGLRKMYPGLTLRDLVATGFGLECGKMEWIKHNTGL